MNHLEKRCVELSHRFKRSHISSALNTVNVLDDIYSKKRPSDLVVLGNAHAAMALYVVLEFYGICNAEDMVKRHGTHSTRDIENGITVSGGSLGQAETIAVGMAIADRDRTVYLVTSDGACAEGCVWEAFALAHDLILSNFHVHVIANGFGAYRHINLQRLHERLHAFVFPASLTIHHPVLPDLEWLQGLPGHYVVMNDEQYAEAMQ